MNNETLKEFGKGLIAFGNLIGGLSIVNGLFGDNHNLTTFSTVAIVIYSVFALYVAGLKLINEGTKND